jgi:dipicolinate synthase subunit B
MKGEKQMSLEGIRIGYCLCGSFCTFEKSFKAAQKLVSEGAQLIPVMSYNSSGLSTRFGTSEEMRGTMEETCGQPIINTIAAAEPIGPKKQLDVLVIAPCTGNTLGKLANGITDTAVTLAAKAHLRNGRPVIVAVSTNDALAASGENIGRLMNRKHFYFVPYRQDDPYKKETSLVADFKRIPATIEAAIDGRQVQPVVLSLS